MELLGRVASGLFPLLLAVTSVAVAAETGDFDGDGKLTIRDVILVRESRADPGTEFAPGSLAAFTEYPPYVYRTFPEPNPSLFLHEYDIPASVYLESLRRTLSGPYPSYSFMHWPDTWLEAVAQEPPERDPQVSIRLLPVETAGEHRIEVGLELTATAPVTAFSLALESEEGMLRVPWVYVIEQDGANGLWRQRDWAFLPAMFRGRHDRGDLTVRVFPGAYLMSGGRYVVSYGFRADIIEPEVSPGTYRILTHGRLPRGTKAGTYPLRILEASQVLLGDGTLLSPTIVGGEGQIVVTEDIESGWDESLPPLRFDVENQRVLGNVEFRFADAEGLGVSEGEPVARGEPGDIVRFRVQVRTETPLNALSFEFRWPKGLVCTLESTPLLEQGGEPVVEPPNIFSTCSHFAGLFQARFFLGGNWSTAGSPARDFTRFYDRPLEYFKPLGEWLDLYEVVVQIPEEPPLDRIPLEFLPYRRGDANSVGGSWVRAEFAPYTANYYADYVGVDDAWPERDLWEYDVRFHEAFVQVVGGEPPPPPNHFIHFEIEDVVVPPGGIVEIPVLAYAADPLSRLRLVLEVDPESLTVEALDTLGRNPETELTSRIVIERGDRVAFRSPDCPPEEENVPCFGVPHHILFWETEERYAAFDWADLGVGGPWPGPNPKEIARLVVRAAENPRSTEVEIRAAKVKIEEGALSETLESGGIADRPDPVVPFSPARGVAEATVRIGRNGFFLRGDVNADSSLNLSDPVSFLDYLFASGEEPSCLDTADADDNGLLQLTDAVFLLQWLFGTGDAPPPPQDCGEDPTKDEIPCDRNVCRRE